MRRKRKKRNGLREIPDELWDEYVRAKMELDSVKEKIKKITGAKICAF